MPTWINFLASGCSDTVCFPAGQVFKLGPLGAFIAIPVAETVMALVAYYYFRKENGNRSLFNQYFYQVWNESLVCIPYFVFPTSYFWYMSNNVIPRSPAIRN